MAQLSAVTERTINPNANLPARKAIICMARTKLFVGSTAGVNRHQLVTVSCLVKLLSRRINHNFWLFIFVIKKIDQGFRVLRLLKLEIFEILFPPNSFRSSSVITKITAAQTSIINRLTSNGIACYVGIIKQTNLCYMLIKLVPIALISTER